MTISAILLFGATAVGPAPSPSPPQPRSVSHNGVRFDRGSSAKRIPVEIAGDGLLFVKGKVQEQDFWFLLDTASASVLSQKAAEKVGLLPPQAPSGAAAEEKPSPRTLAQVTIRLPGVELTERSVSSFDLDMFQTVLGHKVDGVLGASLFGRFAVELDYTGATIALSDPRTYRFPGRAAVVPVRLEGDHPFVEGHLTLPGRPPMAGSLLIDTGVDNAVILFSPFVAARGLLRDAPKVAPETTPAAGGGSLEAMVRAEKLEVGPFVFRDPVVQLSRSTQGPLADGKHAGLIGGAVLSRFRVTLDLSHERLWLERNRHYGDPFLHDASGLSFVPVGPDLTSFLVRRVSPGSPGAQAGFAVGDVIVAVDGKPAKDVTLRGLRRLLQQEGNTYVLSIFREGEIKKLSIACRRLL